MVRVFSLSNLVLLLSSSSVALHAQELSLQKLVSLTELPATLTVQEQTEANLPTWSFQPTTPLPQQELLTWGWQPANTPVAAIPTTLLSLRPNRGLVDVVLHLRKPALLHSLRRELVRQKLAPEAVTCLNCAGERFATSTYSVALYQDKPGPYPYIVVVHPNEKTAPKPATPTSSSR